MIKSLPTFAQHAIHTKEARMLLFLMALATLCTLLLGSANLAFQKASAIFDRRLYRVILEQSEIPFEETEVEAAFATHFETRKIGNTTYYVAADPEERIIVFKTHGPGLWSTIELLLAVSPDLERIEWLTVLAQAETPGLGGRIAEGEFQQRFRGVELRPQVKVVKFASGPNEIDAITGASMTSTAVEKIINHAVRELDLAFDRTS